MLTLSFMAFRIGYVVDVRLFLTLCVCVYVCVNILGIIGSMGCGLNERPIF